MDRDVNYVAVGAFVLLVLAMGISFVYWYTDHQDKHVYQRYEIYFKGTVSGLTEGSPVRYLGVDVGKVVGIALDQMQRKQVQVVAEIDSHAPIDGRTLALLSLQGITGLLYIDLEQEKGVAAASPLSPGVTYPVIRSVPSDLNVLLSSLPALASHAIELIDHFNQVFDDENLHNVKVMLDSTRKASERLPETVAGMQTLVVSLQHAAREVDGVAVDLRSIEKTAAPELQAALANVHHVTDNLVATTGNLDRFIAANEPSVSRFTRQSLPELERLLQESRAAANDFRDLSRTLKQNPSMLLYESNARGVEVPR